MTIPPQCKGCNKNEAGVDACNIRIYRFQVFNRQCPRELTFTETSKETPPSQPKVLSLLVDEYKTLPIPMIAWKEPVRENLTAKNIQDMATSLRLHGQIHAITVQPSDPETGLFQGVSGRLRYEGAKYAGLPEILCRIHKFDSECDRRNWQLAENLHRRDLTTIQKAEAYKELYESYKEEFGGVHDKHIVSKIAKNIVEASGEKAPAERTIQKYIQVSRELPEDVKKTVTSDAFGIRHAEQLLRLKDKPEEQLKLAEQFSHSATFRKPWSVKKMKDKVDKILNPPAPKPEPIDTGTIFECNVCGKKYTIIHVEEGKHRFQKVVVM